METINLYEIVTAYRHLNKDSAEAFCKLNHFHLKDSEILPLTSFVDSILSCAENDGMKYLDHFLVCFEIPQIGTEFDLLAIGKGGVVNIELKSTSTVSKRLTQLLKNKYYLKCIRQNVILYSYDDSLKSFGRLESNEEDVILAPASPSDIVDSLELIKPQPISKEALDALFSPSRYLVSPFNNTEEFLKGEYFLTQHQNEIKTRIIRAIDNKESLFWGITGGAGTGKTLLLYDIVRNLSTRYQVALVHCGALNVGHEQLIEKGWNIYPIREFYDQCCSNNGVIGYDVIAIDEVQRIHSYQYDNIISWVNSDSVFCLFSFDDVQVLRGSEAENRIGIRIRNLCQKKLSQLTRSIRINQNIYGFIDSLFNSRNHYEPSANNISISYCGTVEELNNELLYFSRKGYVTPRYTPGTRGTFYYENWFTDVTAPSAHRIIGQEFDNVVAVLGPGLMYNDENKLISIKNGYYSIKGMLYQILTRTRNSLHIIIYDNPEMFDRCIKLLQPKSEPDTE